MKYDKFFEIAEAKGLSSAQIQIAKSKSTSIRLFRKEIDNYTVSSSQSIIACGIYKGKFGLAMTEKVGKDAFEYLVNQIIVSASFIENEDEKELFKGSEKYHKKNIYNKELTLIPIEKKLSVLRNLEKKALEANPLIYEVSEAEYMEIESESEFHNSFGLHLKQKGNYFYYVLGVAAKKGEEIKTNYKVFLDSDFSKFKEDEFVDEVVKGALEKFGGSQCKSGKYPTVLHSDIIGSLLNYFLASASSDEVQKQSSFLMGKLNQKIASSKLTIEEKPLTKNIFFSYFDDEGVATQNKVVVKNGVLKTYFYNLETAKKDGVQSTGNGNWAGTKIGIGFSNVFVKPGKQSFDDLIKDIKEGVYITDVAGLGTGINPQSGDFSCQAQGFMVRDGKVAEPLTLITLSGNLLKMLKDLKGFSSRVDLKLSGISVADALIKSMAIGGK